jgi:excisionase family DNA binding protein
MVDEKYYSTNEAAKVLGIDDETVLAWIHSGQLPAVNVSKKPNGKRPTYRISQSALGRLLIGRQTQSPSKPAATAKPVKRPTPKRYV